MNDHKTAISRYHYNSAYIWEALPKSAIDELHENARIVKYKKGDVIYHAGGYPKSLYIITQGKVKIFQTNEKGSRQTVYIYILGEAFGYRQILCNETYPVTAMAFEDTELMVIQSEIFLSLIERSYFLTRNLLQSMSFEFSVWVNRITSFARKTVKERLALALLILNEKFKVKGKEHLPVVIQISRTDLAEYVGVPLETMVRQLRHFKEEGWIHMRGKVIIIMDYNIIFDIMGD